LLTEDTYTGDPSDPLSLNLYTYCANEPIMYTDPTGHMYMRMEVAPGYFDNVWVETSFDRMNDAIYRYKNSNESQDLINIGRVLYESNGNWNYDRLESVGFSQLQATGNALSNAGSLNRGFDDLSEAVSQIKLMYEGKIKLSDKDRDYYLDTIGKGYYYYNSVLGIDFDENLKPIANDNLYLAYGAKTKHFMDFEDSLFFSDAGIGFEGISQGHRVAQMLMGISGGMGYKNGRFGVDPYANSSKYHFELTGQNSKFKAPTEPNYIKPTIVENSIRCRSPVNAVKTQVKRIVTNNSGQLKLGNSNEGIDNIANKPTPRTGPKGVDPKHHNLNVMVKSKDGTVKSHERLISGNMTQEEKAMGYPKGQNASHTEARFVRNRGDMLEQGDSVAMTGQKPPCNSCKGYMNRLGQAKDVNITYRWRQDGGTKSWKAKR